MPHHEFDNPNFPYPPPAHRPVPTGARSALCLADAPRTNSTAGENLISPAFLLWIFRQWWKVVVPSGLLLAALVGATVFYFYTPKYEAKALLMIEDVSPFVAYGEHATGRVSNSYIQTQLELLRSPVVLEPMLSRAEIASLRELSDAEDRVQYLQKRLSISRIGGSELYNISYTSPSPEAAASVVNSILLEYMEIQTSDEFQRSQTVIDILEEERRRRALEVERLRKRVVDLAKEVTGKDPFAGNSVTNLEFLLNPVESLFSGLTQLDVDREVLLAELKSLTDTPAPWRDPGESSGLLDLEVENHPSIQQGALALAAVEAGMEEIKQRAVRFRKKPEWESDPNYIALQDESKLREEELIEAKKTLREIVLSQRKAQRELAREEQAAKLKHELEVLDTRRELLSQRFNDQIRQMQTGEAKGVELEFARAELAREDKVFELIASRKLALQTELRAPARVHLRQKANPPTVPVEKVPYNTLLLACSAAFCLPFGLAVVKEITVRRINDVDQLAQESRLRVLGEIATLPVRHVAISPRKLVGKIRRDAFIYAESINTLRTNLVVADELRDRQVLAVMSSSSSEGKTSVATSLAMSIASATDSPTLIIDADMRSPDVATMLKTKSHPGLYEVLTHKCKLEEAIHQVGDTNLYAIPAGRAHRSPHHLVKVDETKQLLDRLRNKFSTIVIDTPPILGASESVVIAKAADAVLFCSLCDISRVKQVRMAVERLEHANVSVAGAVLSGSSARRYAFTYGYYPNAAEDNG